MPDLVAGERWRLVVRLKRPHGTVNPHGFDVEAWLLENGLRATGYVRSGARNARLDAFAGRASDYVQRAREDVRARIVAALPDARFAGVIVALTIGEQRAIPEAQWAVFNRTGIAHLISISGLHVTVFAALAGGLAFALARRSVALTTRVPARRVAAAVGLAFSTFYVLLAGAQVPAVRTLLMLAVAAIGVLVARPGTAAVVWLWALAAVLAWDPWAGLTPGLLAVVRRRRRAALCGHGPALVAATRLARRAHRCARCAPPRARRPSSLWRWCRERSRCSSRCRSCRRSRMRWRFPSSRSSSCRLALAAIVVPVDALWQAAHAVFAGADGPARGARGGAGGGVATACAAGLDGGGRARRHRSGSPHRAACRGGSLGIVALLPLFVVRPAPPPPGAFRMTVLDVGQGLAVVVTTHRHALLYDTGPRYTDDADAGGRIVAPFLRAAGVRRLGGMIVTHQDSDHCGGALTLLQTTSA